MINKTDSDIFVEYHADDYGLFVAQSERILDCFRSGKLNGISIMANGPHLDACMLLLEPYKRDIEVTVHLNLMEGHSVCDPSRIPLLVDENGILNGSFGKLLINSFLPKRKAYRSQLQEELSAQINVIRQCLGQDQPLRLDGHAHYHMLPVVFDAMMDVIEKEKLDVSYIRIPREKMGIYLKHLTRMPDLSWINLVKVIVLHCLSTRNLWKYRKVMQHYEKKLFMGVALSGRMFRENLEVVLPDLMEIAEREHCGIEVLAHPGGVYEDADIALLTNVDDIKFLTDPSRKKEASMFLH